MKLLEKRFPEVINVQNTYQTFWAGFALVRVSWKLVSTHGDFIRAERVKKKYYIFGSLCMYPLIKKPEL